MHFARLTATTAAVLLLAGVSACSSTSTTAAAPTSATGAACTPSTLQTQKSGVLTIAADQPVYTPWFVNNDPANGKGYEAAVAYAVATKLGYTKSQVQWTRVTFNQAIAAGPKHFDIDLDEFSITPERAKVVDFSSPYYDVQQAVVTLKGSKAASVTTLAGLKTLHLGAQVGTTSYTAITDQIQPSVQPNVYNTNDDAVTALKDHQVDAIVTDLPTAFYIAGGELSNGVIVGQLPPAGGKQEQFGILLNLHSPLTSCVSAVVSALNANGTLAKLQATWLANTAGAPVLH